MAPIRMAPLRSTAAGGRLGFVVGDTFVTTYITQGDGEKAKARTSGARWLPKLMCHRVDTGVGANLTSHLHLAITNEQKSEWPRH